MENEPTNGVTGLIPGACQPWRNVSYFLRTTGRRYEPQPGGPPVNYIHQRENERRFNALHV